jgi:lactoylglutathione lyase
MMIAAILCMIRLQQGSHGMEPFFRKIDCYSIKVGNLEAALAFYSSGLGHELVWRTATAAGLRLPESDAELVIHTDPTPTETEFLVPSVPEAVRRFQQAGGNLIAGPFEIKIGLCAVVSDPWGNLLVILDMSKGKLKVDKDKNVV